MRYTIPMQTPTSKPRILIYGDSNVWGENFSGARIKYSGRWVNRLSRSMRKKARVVADGVTGRVAGDFRADKPRKNGKTAFAPVLQRTSPDIIIIALGTNDLQQRFNRSAANIVDDLLFYKKAAKKARVIYLLPPPFDTGEQSGPEFTEQSERVRQELLQASDKLGNCIELPQLPLSDGLHFSLRGHRIVSSIVRNVLESYL